jgi:hypothetical protein
MNDPIKDFIEKNREEFDHLEAPAFDMNKFKARTAETTPVEKPVFKLGNGIKWMAAASVVIALGTFLFLNGKQEKLNQTALKQDKTSDKPLTLPDERNPEQIATLPVRIKPQQSVDRSFPKKSKLAEKQTNDIGQENLFANLSDSSSSSTRLAAILEIKKQGTMSDYVVNRLASTLNNDNNSNVRLAALGILRNYSDDRSVSALLVNSLNTQTDPMVQLELVTLLGNMEHLKIEDKLYALAADPNTFGAVKDEAYSILLNQNKL